MFPPASSAGQARPEPLSLEELDYVLLIAGWFRQFPKEQEVGRNPAQVLEECLRKADQRDLLS